MDNRLTPNEFNGIRRNLEQISSTWADLWVILHLTQARVTHLLRCKYQDIHDDVMHLSAHRVFRESHIALGLTVRAIIRHRQKRYPEDTFLFQSHSSRVRATAQPVTVIAFNIALKKAASGVTSKNISSKSALSVHPEVAEWPANAP